MPLTQVFFLVQREGIRQANPIERQIVAAHDVMVDLLDINCGNVVRQQDNLVGMNLLLVFVGKLCSWVIRPLCNRRVIKVPVPVKGSRIWTPRSPSVCPNSVCKTSFSRFAHFDS